MKLPSMTGGEKRVCRLYKRQMQENDFCSYGEMDGDEKMTNYEKIKNMRRVNNG